MALSQAQMICHKARMIRKLTLLACVASIAALPVAAAEEPAKPEYPSPPEIVAKATAEEWLAIAPSDLLVMDLAPDAKGKTRRVVIQLMPAPFSQGWVGNIRKLATAKFWDGTSVNRVQDNYVVQWGDATEKKALPEGLAVVPESEYSASGAKGDLDTLLSSFHRRFPEYAKKFPESRNASQADLSRSLRKSLKADPYAEAHIFAEGWPFASDIRAGLAWPTHCYAMVGVGRNLAPDTGTGAELYTVIGHAPRHLDRNIALVGRVIEGIEHLSSLPRGTGALGFYEKEEERVPIISVRIASDMETDKPFPVYEYLSTESASFAAYADARANRRDPFFNVPAGGADICNIPVPVRRKGK
jgi:cyclophilin family peptidyl-prolyl cis-trans isomerase